MRNETLSCDTDTIVMTTYAWSGEDLPLGDRRNMGYMGTAVTQGHGLALVVATGMQTELGKIADLIQEVKEEKAPLQYRLDSLGKALALLGLGIKALSFHLGCM